MTEEIRAAQQDETPTTCSPDIQSSDNVVYEYAL